MRKSTLLVLAALTMVALFCQVVFAETDHLTEYQNAVGNYYEVPLADIQTAIEAGITDEELPVLFDIAQQAGVSSATIVTVRSGGASWQKIAETHKLNAGDFYVSYRDLVRGSAFNRTFGKFSGLNRSQRCEVKLDDADYVNLANLKFLYRHYNYSQSLIVNWHGETNSFVNVNHRVYSATSQMNSIKMAGAE